MVNTEVFTLADHAERIRYQISKAIMLTEEIINEIEDAPRLEKKASILSDVLDMGDDMLVALTDKLTAKKAS